LGIQDTRPTAPQDPVAAFQHSLQLSKTTTNTNQSRTHMPNNCPYRIPVIPYQTLLAIRSEETWYSLHSFTTAGISDLSLKLVLCICTLQTKPLVIHKSDEQSRKNKLHIVTPISLLAVGTKTYYKSG
jgi:hypothetical protein